MKLGALSVMFRGASMPVDAAALAKVDGEGPRRFNYAVTSGLAREGARVRSALVHLLLLGFCAFELNGSGPSLVAFLIAGAATTVALDWIRLFTAEPWVKRSLRREHRVEQLLTLTRAVERGEPFAPDPGTAQSKSAAVLALAVTGVGVPLFWYAMVAIGWVRWKSLLLDSSVLALITAVVVWRIIRGILAIRAAKRLPVGDIDVFLDAEDVLETYALMVLLTVALMPLGKNALVTMPFLVISVRLLYRLYQYGSYRLKLRILERRLKRPGANLPDGALEELNDDEFGDTSDAS